MKKFLSTALIVILVFTSFLCFSTTSYAAAKRPIKSISLNTRKVTLIAGRSTTLKATIKPSNTTQSKTVLWYTSNKNVATVNSKGKVTAKKAGTATITAKCKANKKKKITCKVTVKKAYPLKGITIKNPNTKPVEGQAVQLSVIYNPSNTTDSKTVKWTSSNTGIATVASNGKVTTKKPGTVKITAKVGNKTAVTTIYVQKRVIALTGLKLDKTSDTLKTGNSLQLIATKVPSNTTVTTAITWSTNNASIANVNSNGLVTAVNSGNAIITAKCENIQTTASIEVEPNIIPINSISTDVENDLTMELGDTKQVNVLYNPEDTTEREVYWTSSNLSVATVSDEGLITAVGEGTSIIKCKSAYDGVEDVIINLTVEDNTQPPEPPAPSVIPLDQLSFNPSTITIDISDSYQLEPSFTPSNTTQTDVEYVVVGPNNQSDYIDVSEEGVVTAKKVGTGFVQVRSKENSSITALCTIKVVLNVDSIYFDEEEISVPYDQIETGIELKCLPEKEGFSNKLAEWTIDDPSIASVEGNNKIYHKQKIGTTTVTATYQGKTASIILHVVDVEYYVDDIEPGYNQSMIDELNSWRMNPDNWWYWNKDDETKTYLKNMNPLIRNPQLDEMAKQRAKNAWERWFVQGLTDHRNPDGSSSGTLFPKPFIPVGNYEDLEYYTIIPGENLSNGRGPWLMSNAEYGFPEDNCPYSGQGHRRNQLNYNTVEVGVATYYKNGKQITAVEFAQIPYYYDPADYIEGYEGDGD